MTERSGAPGYAILSRRNGNETGSEWLGDPANRWAQKLRRRAVQCAERKRFALAATAEQRCLNIAVNLLATKPGLRPQNGGLVQPTASALPATCTAVSE